MIRFFRSSFLAQYVLLTLLAALLWLPAMLWPLAPENALPSEPLYGLISAPLTNFPIISVLLAFLLMLVGGYVFNSILSWHGLIPRISTYGMLMWVLTASGFPQTMHFNPLWPALIVLLFAINLAFSMYERENNNYKLFNLGFLITFAALFHQAAWVFTLWVLLVLFILRVNKLREWLIPLLGFFVPVLYLLVIWFLQNSLITRTIDFLSSFGQNTGIPPRPDVLQLVLYVFLLLLFFNAINFNYSLKADRIIAARKRKAMLNVFLLIGFAAFILRQGDIFSNAFVVIPLGAHLAIWAGTIQRTSRPSTILWFYVILAFLNNAVFFLTSAQASLP